MSSIPEDCAREVLDTVPSIMKTIKSRMNSQRSGELTVQQFRALVFLSRAGEASLSDLAWRMRLTLPTMSRLINVLVNRGLVERQISSTDRRYITLTITPKGKDLLASAHQHTQSYLVEIFSQVPEQDLVTLLRAMKTLKTIFGNDQSASRP